MDLELVLLVIYMSVIGAGLGVFTGITPGIHVNTLASMMLLLSPALCASMLPVMAAFGQSEDLAVVMLACLLVSASVVHSYLDFIPSVFLGAPDDAEAMSMLPGHRLLLVGKGYQAVMAAAKGSLVGASAAMIVSVPMAYIFLMDGGLAERFDAFIPWLLFVAVVIMVMSERDDLRAIWTIEVDKVSYGHVRYERSRPPIDGALVKASGVVHRTGPFSYVMDHAGHRRRLRRYHGASGRIVTVEGRWLMHRRRWTRKAQSLMVFSLSGLLGLVVMEGRPPPQGIFSGLGAEMLFPLLTGLFALPSLLTSLSPAPLQEQSMEDEADPYQMPAAQGCLAGLFAAWVPGITSTTGTVIGTLLRRTEAEGDEKAAASFIAMNASVGTSVAVFGILALVMAGSGGSGVLMVVERMTSASPLEPMPFLAVLMLSCLTASVLGYWLTERCGRYFTRWFQGVDMGKASRIIIGLDIVLCIIFAGLPGLVVMTVATLLGMVPPALGVGRISMTGCLLLPLLLYFLGLMPFFLSITGGG